MALAASRAKTPTWRIQGKMTTVYEYNEAAVHMTHEGQRTDMSNCKDQGTRWMAWMRPDGPAGRRRRRGECKRTKIEVDNQRDEERAKITTHEKKGSYTVGQMSPQRCTR